MGRRRPPTSTSELVVLVASPRVSRRPASFLATVLLLAIAQGLLLRRLALPGPTLTRRFTRLLPPRTISEGRAGPPLGSLPARPRGESCRVRAGKAGPR